MTFRSNQELNTDTKQTFVIENLRRQPQFLIDLLGQTIDTHSLQLVIETGVATWERIWHGKLLVDSHLIWLTLVLCETLYPPVGLDRLGCPNLD